VAEGLTMNRLRLPTTPAEDHEPPTPATVEVRQSELAYLMRAFEKLQRKMPNVPVRPGSIAAGRGQRDTAAPNGGYPGTSLPTEICARIARELVAQVLDADPLLMRAKPRGARRLAAARQFAIHLVHSVAGRKHEEVARAFARNRSTAAHHFEVIEDLRDVTAFDEFMSMLERAYSLRLQMAELRFRPAWANALASIDAALDTGLLEGDGHSMGEYLVGVFREKAA
jgi:hypothetical protein